MLSRAQIELAINATDSEINESIREIINYTQHALDINDNDIEYLSKFFNFQRDIRGKIFPIQAKSQLISLLNKFPAFRASTKNIILQKIAIYFNAHPDEIEQQTPPNWYSTPTFFGHSSSMVYF